MKTIKLHSMTLTAFKGIKSSHIDFTEETNIFGANATGKTTIMDAFLWLLFDKDSTGRKDFEIKTLDENGIPILQIDHEVEAVISVDGQEIEIKKVYSEKWTKKRGSEEAEFTGHETTYFWNGVPMRQKDFQENVAGICDEYIFKLITSPTAFNDLHWEKRREILLEIAGEISDTDIAGDNPNYLKVAKELSIAGSEDDYRKKLNASVKKQKEELALIPARIDEVEKNKPETPDFLKIKGDVDRLERDIKSIDDQIENSSKAYQSELDKINEHNRKINNAKLELDNIVYTAKREAQRQLSEKTDDSSDLNNRIKEINQKYQTELNRKLTLSSSISTMEMKIRNIESEMSEKRAQWTQVNSEHYHGDENCPTCHQHLPEEMISDMTEKYNTEKQEKLNRIQRYGTSLKTEKESVQTQLIESEKELEKLTELISELQKQAGDLEHERQSNLEAAPAKPQMTVEEKLTIILKDNQEYLSKRKEIGILELEKPEQPVIDNSELKAKRSEIQLEIDTLKIELNKKNLIIQATERIKELKERQKNLAQEVAGVDKDMFALDEFMKLKVDEIERRIRNRFQFVSFRMFKEQINGGLRPVCDILVNGVPYSDANTASKINAGVDVINTLSDFYGVSAPIFLDNRESVTNILPTGTQLINLIVSPEDSKLRIENKKAIELLTK